MNKLTESEVENIRKRELLLIGEFIKRKRTKQSATQNDVADVLGVSNAEVSYYESGSRDMPISSFSVIGECLDFKLKDYVLEIEPRKAVHLYNDAINRAEGKDDMYRIGFVTTPAPIRIKKSSERMDFLTREINYYFESDKSDTAKRMLVLADMLYREMSDKSAMRYTYECIVDEIAETGERRMNAIFREYISNVRNER